MIKSNEYRECLEENWILCIMFKNAEIYNINLSLLQ